MLQARQVQFNYIVWCTIQEHYLFGRSLMFINFNFNILSTLFYPLPYCPNASRTAKISTLIHKNKTQNQHLPLSVVYPKNKRLFCGSSSANSCDTPRKLHLLCPLGWSKSLVARLVFRLVLLHALGFLKSEKPRPHPSLTPPSAAA